MKNRQHHPAQRPARAVVALAIASLFTALTTLPAQAQYAGEVRVESNDAGWLYDLGTVISIFVDAPLEEPEPVAIGWAPPPMLVEDLPPPPEPDAVWTGGYWTWQGDWVWCAGRWMVPPRPQYVWVQPYYEHRDERVIFLPGYWSRPDVEFVAPSYDRPIAWAYVGANVVVGPPPMGPSGIFIPPPPGSRPGIIIPAPVGTPPAVVVSAPPVMNVGMSIHGNLNINSHNTVINDNRVTNYNVTNVRNVTNVVIQAPAGATANGRAFEATVPHQAHLAAAQQPVVSVRAPIPASRTAVQAYVPGRTVAALPAPQHVQGLPTVPSHPVAALSQAQRGQMAHAPIVPAPHVAAPTTEAGPKPAITAGALTPTRPEQGRSVEQAQPRGALAGELKQPSLQSAEQQRQHAQEEAAQQRAQVDAQTRQRAQQQAEQQRVLGEERTQQAQQQQRAQAEARLREQQQAQQQRAQGEEQARQREQQQAQQQRAQADARAQQAQQQQRAQAEAQAQQREQQQAQQQRAQADARAHQAEQQQRAQAEAQAQQREQQQAQQRAQQALQQQRVQAEEQARQRAQQPSQAPRPTEAEAHGRPAPHASGPANGHPTPEEERTR